MFQNMRQSGIIGGDGAESDGEEILRVGGMEMGQKNTTLFMLSQIGGTPEFRD